MYNKDNKRITPVTIPVFRLTTNQVDLCRYLLVYLVFSVNLWHKKLDQHDFQSLHEHQNRHQNSGTVEDIPQLCVDL